ncbi:MAG: gamma-glutamyl-gamma-aminobutyrate hydrolase family protein [Methanothrix sp.]|jgi:GMP synthase (glutamine-hydrolysing)|uniref:Glutamine amidotransferase class-I n=1 Tax=Methanothrix harundinacea TaxID=301375 RepID=A0A117MC52_9EURY|nr:MAG: Glutamine amidotransferase class-I [Methanothrix harundinacea]MDD2638032.1 gamma-glutamyl-gamma-aminobutyrate hydrolase family protein [Methanothrix sp.]MDI9398303.1 gamma-glutamyl-gamma-aminobutyrate hydrolase family protein [Euryarchaeota archaeon]KUK95904.1 MAG: Glutamine amidotransferase class-I [Methanothrix harundinacea]MCP1392327.1 gamma-glutamyl-gamma-aminobutyrate hydrolase family protein [Methanothrix harundinacea]
MILIVDLCHKAESLSKYEFVDPIASIVRRTGSEFKVRHFSELTAKEIERSDGIVLCGTPLKDDLRARRIELFIWIRDFDRPLLAICAGMQVVAAVFGGEIVPQPKIGLERIEILKETDLLGPPGEIEGYHLHNFGVTLPSGFDLVAGRAGQIEAFKHSGRPIYGIIFHPEVRNKWIVERFLDLG